MNKDITKFFEIQGYLVYQTRIDNHQNIIVRIGRPKNKDECPYCQSKKHYLHSKGEWTLKKHSNFQEKQIYLEVKRKRYKCKQCQRVFSEELPDIPKYARKTNNFIKQSLNYLSKNSFNEVAKVNQISYSSLKDQLYNYVNPYQLLEHQIQQLNRLDEIYLGLDGQSFRGQKMVLTITEVNLKELITILPSESQSDLLIFLKQLPLSIRLKVKGISIDMTNKHISLLRQYFPNAKIVIDHYHVIQQAIYRLQEVRRILQNVARINIPIKKELDKNYESLNNEEKIKMLKYFIIYPELKEAYWFKERLRSIYRIKKYNKATRKYIILKKELLKHSNNSLKELGRTLRNWQVEILNYFITKKITNAYTEGIHTKCKLIKRKSYGFKNVDTYVRKLLLGLIPLITILSLHTI
jgi:transposase